METKKIGIPAVIILILAAILITYGTTLLLLHREREAGGGKYTASDKLAEAADAIKSNYIGEYDEAAMTDAAINAMVESLGDRWSYYMTADELKAYNKTTSNEYSGIGIVVEKDGEGGIRIASVYEESPAGRAGIVAGSVITAVGGADVSGWTLDDALVKIKEQIDAGEVSLTLRQPDGAVKSFALTPGPVVTNPVEYELLDGGIGLITILNFEALCASRTEAAINELTERGAKALVFDLRGNPGGQLDELLNVLDYILPEGTIFISKEIDGTVKEEKSGASCVELPMAVLINGDTYSAAEFFAAALGEYGWAVTVGEKTTGKGYAQITVELSDGSAIHISSMEYYTPKGRSLAGTGLTPDIRVEMSEGDRVKLYSGSLPHADDAQLAAALEALGEKMKNAA